MNKHSISIILFMAGSVFAIIVFTLAVPDQPRDVALGDSSPSLLDRIKAWVSRESAVDVFRMRRIRALSELEKQARTSYSARLELVNSFGNDPVVSGRVYEILGALGPLSVDALIVGATNGDVQVRAWSLVTFGKIKNAPNACIPVLLRACGDVDADVRLCALRTLAKFTNAPPEVWRIFKQRLFSTNTLERFESAVAILRVQPPDLLSVTVLVHTLIELPASTLQRGLEIVAKLPREMMSESVCAELQQQLSLARVDYSRWHIGLILREHCPDWQGFVALAEALSESTNEVVRLKAREVLRK